MAGSDPARPRILLTASDALASNGEPDRRTVPYRAAIERAGADPFVPANDLTRLEESLERADGIVLSGGVDVDPERYGGRIEHANSEAGSYRADRDAFEIAVARAARDRRIPILAICRGLQVANVAYGGTLIEDLREELGAGYLIEHDQKQRSIARSRYAPGHIVTLDDHSRVAALAGARRVRTNSMHHQAVRRVAGDLTVTGRCDDGTIEALEPRFDHPYFIAVQWHPEELAAHDALAVALFDGVVRAALATTR